MSAVFTDLINSRKRETHRNYQVGNRCFDGNKVLVNRENKTKEIRRS